MMGDHGVQLPGDPQPLLGDATTGLRFLARLRPQPAAYEGAGGVPAAAGIRRRVA
ncbi:uncharacterized protein SAZU_2270 [Streptomyces azureus]|uniref:Uncharacterized protein n=1 Tax=Streptomyces azureus TaxID=146537 RepID=A0A0K8PII7_STRAJ|nr:uncharacterized protein SAZU_2270 [Streptomyces azureus]